MRTLTALILTFLLCSTAMAEDFDAELHQKAIDYQDWIDLWHTGDIGLPQQGLGGLPAEVQFTDDTYTEIACLHATGDSMIWTGMYLGSQALRYAVTQDPEAKAEAIRLVTYMHNNMEMTGTLGYIARYADLDQHPYNCNMADGHGWKVHGTGEWEGYFWIHETSRDQYSGYMWGMTMAYQHIDDPDTRDVIRQDLSDVGQMLVENDWNITDENGEYTGNGAAWVGPMMRLGWLVQIAYVNDTPYYWDLLETQYQAMKPLLPVDVWSMFNRYDEFYGNNLRHLAYQPIFRLWPDREQLQHLYDVWMERNRPWVAEIHNPWFDAVHWTGCQRLGVCDPEDVDYIETDALHTLGLYWDVVNYRQEIVCSEQPLDPLSVMLDELLAQVPWLEDIINIDPQTADARELNDRHWTDMYWQSGGHFQASCHTAEDKTRVGSGFDYLVAYWMGVYYGILPGDGPYGDDDLTDDDADDDVDDDVNDDVDDDNDDDIDDDDDDTTQPDDDDADASGDDDDNDDGACCG
jgi:hypothetical protein